jgi:DNA-binding NarL/FixJ family response regulator
VLQQQHYTRIGDVLTCDECGSETLMKKRELNHVSSCSYVRGLKSLTKLEYHVAVSLADGKSNKQIATELQVSHRTIGSHRYNLYCKLGVHNIAGLVKLVLRRDSDG